MTPLERRKAIYAQLSERGVVRLSEMADELSVSTMTIRRDLQHFIRQGVVTMSNGSAYLNQEATDTVAAQVVQGTDERAQRKRSIGRAAAELVADGDTIIVDCGTTTLQMLDQLGDKRVTVITNSLPVAGVVGTNPQMKLIFAPGEYSEESRGTVGALAVDFFRTINVGKAFLGANGFDARGGANEPVVADATVKRAMLDAAGASYLLVDSDKYGNVHLMSSTRLDEYACVITDEKFPVDKRAELEAACRAVRYV